jgi:hypothetical protein
LVTAGGGDYSSDNQDRDSKWRTRPLPSEEEVGAVSSGLSGADESSSDGEQGQGDKDMQSEDRDDADQGGGGDDDDDEGSDSNMGGSSDDASSFDGDAGRKHGKNRKEGRLLNVDVGENQHIAELKKKWKDNEMHALKWYRRAAKLGHPWAIVMAADCYARYVWALLVCTLPSI